MSAVGGIILNPNGLTVVVTVTSSSGRSLSLYSDPELQTPAANPLTITTRTPLYVGERVVANVSCKLNGTEIATSSGAALSYHFAGGAVSEVGLSSPFSPNEDAADRGTYAPLQVLSGATVDAARTAFLGDSITTLNGTGDVATFENTIDNYSGHIPVLSAGRVLYGRSFGAAGYTLEQIRDTVLPRLLAAPVLPGTVVLLGGTNNVGLGVSFVLSSAMTAVENIRATLAALGIRLVVCTIPPRADNTTANNNVTVLNAAISAYARKKGLNLLDFYGALVNPATGLFAAGMSNADLIHPSPAGMLAMANAAIAGGFHLRNPAWKPDLVRGAIDTASFITPATRALFQIDTNADGIADGLTAFGGTKTASLVAASGGDIVGQWQRISRTTTDTGGTSYLQFNTVLGSFAVAGDRLSLACRLKVTGATGAYTYTTTPVGVRISLDLKDAGNVDQDVVRYQTSQDIDGTVYLERTVRSDTGKLAVTFGADVPSVGTVVAQIAQVTVRNLTALGYV